MNHPVDEINDAYYKRFSTNVMSLQIHSDDEECDNHLLEKSQEKRADYINPLITYIKGRSIQLGFGTSRSGAFSSRLISNLKKWRTKKAREMLRWWFSESPHIRCRSKWSTKVTHTGSILLCYHCKSLAGKPTLKISCKMWIKVIHRSDPHNVITWLLGKVPGC